MKDYLRNTDEKLVVHTVPHYLHTCLTKEQKGVFCYYKE